MDIFKNPYCFQFWNKKVMKFFFAEKCLLSLTLPGPRSTEIRTTVLSTAAIEPSSMHEVVTTTIDKSTWMQ
jgi:hypothetical protein